MTLNWLFRARFSDGTEILQTPEDVSHIDPKRSAFYDVTHRNGELTRFSIHNGPRSFTVDLSDGHFDMNGVRFEAGDPRERIPPDCKRELVYFRRRTEHFNVGLQPLAESCEHHIGWKAQVAGKAVMVTVSVPNS